MKTLNFKVLKLDQVYVDSIKLWEKIVKDGFKPTIIIAVLDGGYLPSKILSELWGGLKLVTVKVKAYKGFMKKKPKIIQPFSMFPKKGNILVVDDVADSGETLKLVLNSLKGKKLNVKTATLHKKPWSKYSPNYYVHEVKEWIVYPWEYVETIQNIAKKFKVEGENLKKTNDFLVKIGLSKEIVRKILSLIF